MEWIDVKLQPDLADAARALAAWRDVTVSQLVRDLVRREVDLTALVAPPEPSASHPFAALRARFLSDFTKARNWQDLNAKVQSKGHCLVAANGGLILRHTMTGRRVCVIALLGFSYDALMELMGGPFPRRARRAPQRKPNQMNRAPSKPILVDQSDDFDVIEPF